MNSVLDFLLLLGDDTLPIKNYSLGFLTFAVIPFILSLIKIKIIKQWKTISIESFWVIFFLTNIIQLVLATIVYLEVYSYVIVSISLAIVLVLFLKGVIYENKRIN